MSQNNNNDKDSKKLLDKKPSEGGEMKKGSDAVPPKGSKDGKKDPKAQKEEELVNKAYEFAKHAHEGQKRLSGEPYFVHVFETAKNLAIIGMDTKTIMAGLLHDVLEDTKIIEKE